MLVGEGDSATDGESTASSSFDAFRLLSAPEAPIGESSEIVRACNFFAVSMFVLLS